MSDLTQVLTAIEQNQARADQLLPLVYDELRQLAAARLAQERPGQTLQGTALVHEVWLKLAGEKARSWQGRTHFFAAAAEAMRRILIDNARRKHAARHGGELVRVSIDDSTAQIAAPVADED